MSPVLRNSIAFQSGAFELAGTIDLPDQKQDLFPGVIYCHGFTGNRIESRRLYARLGRILADEGIASFRFDHRGCGESEGDFIDFTPDGMYQDLDTALEQFLSQPWLDHSRVAVVGYSLGGNNGSYLLSRHPQFTTAAFWAGVAEPGIIRERLARNPDFESYHDKGYYDLSGFRVSSYYLDEIGMKSRPVEWAASFPKPVLFIHGLADDVVPVGHVDMYLNARNNTHDRKVIIENADHAFSNADNLDRVLQETVSWLRTHLCAAEPHTSS